MIIKRKRQHQPVRAIVKRQKPQPPPRMIVRRNRPLGVQHNESGGRRHWWLPSLAILSWRPGAWTYALACAFAVAVLAGAGAYWAFTSPYFKVSQVGVTGNQVIPPEVIAERLQIGGQSMFSVDLEAAQARLTAMPMVKSAHLERVWPNGIQVTIEERQPWGSWEQDGVSYTIDRDGVVLGLLQPPVGSPVIKSAQHGTRQEGDRVDYQAVDAAAELYTRLPEVLGESVTEVAYVPEKGLVVRTADGETAIFGDSSSIDYKLAVWAAMAEAANERHFSYSTIDLRFGNRPVLQ